MGKTKLANTDDATLSATTPETKVKKLGIKIKKPLEIKKPKIEAEVTAESPKAEASESAKVEPKKAAKTKSQPTKVKPRSKAYLKSAELVDKAQKYAVKDAIELVKQASYWKGKTSTVEIHINTNVKNIRGLVSLPFAAAKELRVLAFGKGAKEAGADIEGDEATLAEIEKGKINFDTVVATPDWMPKLAKVARILGPKGLMPNPKNETVTTNLSRTIADLKKGKTEYKTENAGQVIHLSIGKIDQPTQEIYDNIKILYAIIGRSKITKITLAPTMGPGVRVLASSI